MNLLLISAFVPALRSAINNNSIIYLSYSINTVILRYVEISLSLSYSLYTVKGMPIRVGIKYSTCTWYLYLSTYLSVLDVLEYLVYGNVKVLVLVLDQKVLGT